MTRFVPGFKNRKAVLFTGACFREIKEYPAHPGQDGA